MTMATLRRWHLYVGMFIAPSVLFFALTGAVQLFSLHEAHGDYDPPPIVEKLSSVHKDQVFALGHHHRPPAAQIAAGGGEPAKAAPPHDDDDRPAFATVLLKAFFLVVAAGLTASTLIGLWMGLSRQVDRRAALALFVAGAAIPAFLVMMM
jgi:hypothetical protein